MTVVNADALREAMVQTVGQAPAGSIAAYEIVDLPGSEAPWRNTGLRLKAGDVVTLVREGRIALGGSDLWLSAGFNVWARVEGQGPLERGTRASHTFAAHHDGHLELANAQPSEWSDRDGAFSDDPGVYALMTGGSTILALQWSPGVNVAECVRALAAHGDPLLSGTFIAEAERLEGGLGAAPVGWEHLWFIGPSEVFSADDGIITCRTQGDAAIICREVAIDLTEDTVLSWEWKIDALPSLHPESAFETHDYMSIAVEFDDGQDLTYHWSAALEPETTYRCPLPHWSARETHLVVRRGESGLGQWSAESRRVLADHAVAIGGVAPARIVRIWLIALSCMQRLEGSCQYRNIALV